MKDATMKRLRKIVSLLVLFGTAATFGVMMVHADTPEEKKPDDAANESVKSPKIEITLDTSNAPEMTEYAEKAKKTCEESFPMIVKLLDEKDFNPPEKTTIVFKKMKGVAYSAGNTITCSAAWFTEHPDDVGAVVHELAHVVQGYHKRQPPGWVTEGIADYVRWFNFEPENRHPRVGNLRKAKYTDSYQTTAAFFNWIVKNKDPQFVTKLNAEARQGKYKPELFQKFTEKSVDELWGEFVQSQKR
jgi:hypothetical protein